jgi:hypothetical protein
MRPGLQAAAVAIAILGAAAVAGCADPPARSASPAREAAPTGMRPAVPSVALEREIRYYRDEQGDLWDDRGRKLERAR